MIMRGKELKYILKRIPLFYKLFAKLCGKAEGTVQRWITRDEPIGESFILHLEKAITAKRLQLLREEYHELQLQKSKPKHESSKPKD